LPINQLLQEWKSVQNALALFSSPILLPQSGYQWAGTLPVAQSPVC
jgi:hypothetical protein